MRFITFLFVAILCGSCALSGVGRRAASSFGTAETQRFVGEWVLGEPSAKGHYPMRLVITEDTAQLFEDGELVLRGPTVFKDGKLLINAELNKSGYYRDKGGCWAGLHQDNMGLSLYGNTKGLLCFERKIAEQTRLSGDCEIVMRRFQEALSAGQWSDALALCSADVRTKAATYDTSESFCRDVLPLEVFDNPRDFFVCGTTRKGSGAGELIGLRCELRGPVAWACSLHKTGQRWLLDFPTRPLAVWEQEELAVMTRARKDWEERTRALDAKAANLTTRLTAVAGTRFARGARIPLRLELVNGGQAVVWYDAQQVAVNASLKVEDAQGKAVPYGAGPYQTTGHLSPIKPGETVILFDDFDLTKQYPLPRAGEYRVQFTGKGLMIADTEWLAPDSGPVYATKVCVSNVLTIRMD